jgi:hypothetical protein
MKAKTLDLNALMFSANFDDYDDYLDEPNPVPQQPIIFRCWNFLARRSIGYRHPHNYQPQIQIASSYRSHQEV